MYLIKHLFISLLNKWFWFQYLWILKNKKKIVFFDIDNTLADTWQSLNLKFPSEKKRILSLPHFQKVVDVIKKYEKDEYLIIFLSVRPYSQYLSTKRWIYNIGILNFTVFLVKKPDDKLLFLEKISHDISFYDDLSYNQENGELKFYNNVIERLKLLPNITYYDYNYLKTLQKL